MEPMTVDEILQWHAEQMRIAHEREALATEMRRVFSIRDKINEAEQEAHERIPPLGHHRGAVRKALWNSKAKAYEIVPILEPEPDPAQRALDEFIAVRKAKREHAERLERMGAHVPYAETTAKVERERAIARAMARTDPDQPIHQRFKPYRGA